MTVTADIGLSADCAPGFCRERRAALTVVFALPAPGELRRGRRQTPGVPRDTRTDNV